MRVDVNSKDNVKRVALGSDHCAYDEKMTIKRYLQTIGYVVNDVGYNKSYAYKYDQGYEQDA